MEKSQEKEDQHWWKVGFVNNKTPTKERNSVLEKKIFSGYKLYFIKKNTCFSKKSLLQRIYKGEKTFDCYED
eukprot:bmy_11089T0